MCTNLPRESARNLARTRETVHDINALVRLMFFKKNWVKPAFLQISENPNRTWELNALTVSITLRFSSSLGSMQYVWCDGGHCGHWLPVWKQREWRPACALALAEQFVPPMLPISAPRTISMEWSHNLLAANVRVATNYKRALFPNEHIPWTR